MRTFHDAEVIYQVKKFIVSFISEQIMLLRNNYSVHSAATKHHKSWGMAVWLALPIRMQEGQGSYLEEAVK